MAPEQGAAAGRKVVVDAGAAIKLQRLERFGGILYTTSNVLAEVRDERARALLATLPEEIRVREPRPQDLAYARAFAKATGDLGFLSQNDLGLIALAVGLHREEGGAKLREQPHALVADEGMVSFDWAPSHAEQATPAKTRAPAVEAAGPAAAAGSGEPSEEPPAAVSAAAETPAAEAPTSAEAPAPAEAADAKADSVREEEDDDDEDGDSAGEWVTPDNFQRFGLDVKPAAELKVTCATADYSVQNVLLQMGITPLTFDGYAVSSVKLWGLYCRACFHFCRDTEKVFCPKCGNDTIVRVPIIVDQDGKATMLHSGRPLRKKGTVFSMPKPQGGRGWKPVFAQDELLMGGRDRELRHAQNMCNKDRQARDPFNEDNGARGWWQRSSAGGKPLANGAPRAQAGYGRRTNPNANNFKGFGRKKR